MGTTIGFSETARAPLRVEQPEDAQAIRDATPASNNLTRMDLPRLGDARRPAGRARSGLGRAEPLRVGSRREGGDVGADDRRGGMVPDRRGSRKAGPPHFVK